MKTCPICKGVGSVYVAIRTMHGKDIDGDVCPKCNGTGEIPTVADIDYNEAMDIKEEMSKWRME